MNQERTELPPESVEALERGNKIEAIKRLVNSRPMGLKEAKEAVESYLSRHPDLYERFTSSQSSSSRGAAGWLVGLICTGLIAYLMLNAQ